MDDVIIRDVAAQAGHILERARWAARSYAEYDAGSVQRIVDAVAKAAHASARDYAEWAVRETTFGVVEHKVKKNEACSLGLLEIYRNEDFVTPRVDAAKRIVEVPRPAGVVLAITPSTNPIATVYFKVLISLMTRNAVVISPHPMAKQCSADAAKALCAAAVDAGAPDGIVQCIEDPTIPLVESLMADERTNVIVATGGTGVVRAAYGSGNPAIGVGPGNVPVLVDGTANLAEAARYIVESKAFDNSVLCTNESVLIVEDQAAEPLLREMSRLGAFVLSPQEAQILSAYMFPFGRLNTEVVGKDASTIARAAGLKAGPKTRLLIAPFDMVTPDEPMAHEKLSPVLGMVRVRNAEDGIDAARSVVRIAGAGHSAAIHSTDPATVMRYTARVPVLRVAVNVGNSEGSSGLSTNLALTMTVGTGFVGRSSLGENLQPKHLINCAKIAYNSDTSIPFPDFGGLSPWRSCSGPVPPYPVASNASEAGRPSVRAHSLNGVTNQLADGIGNGLGAGRGMDDQRFRTEVRRLVIEELSQLLKD